MTTRDTGQVLAVHRSGSHEFSKTSAPSIELVAGLGVVGDAHQGAQVQHRSRVAADPTQPNLRQVHLIHGELFDEVAEQGFTTRRAASCDGPVSWPWSFAEAGSHQDRRCGFLGPPSLTTSSNRSEGRPGERVRTRGLWFGDGSDL